MGNVWHVEDFLSAKIPSLIWKKSGFPVLFVEKTWWLREVKRAGYIMDVKTIRTVNSCPGRSHPEKNALPATAICWKRETSWYVQINSAVMWWWSLRKKLQRTALHNIRLKGVFLKQKRFFCFGELLFSAEQSFGLIPFCLRAGSKSGRYWRI